MNIVTSLICFDDTVSVGFGRLHQSSMLLDEFDVCDQLGSIQSMMRF